MKSLWNDEETSVYQNDPYQLRVYTSRLLGREPSLVLHGGGNTSVKVKVKNLLGDIEQLLYVKGSGWDLATIDVQGFAPVKLDILKRLVELEQLNDIDMVRIQRSAMTEPNAPSPSVEAILHALIPHTYVDHTHADAIVAITNTRDGDERIHQIYGGRVLIIPYVMPGFMLAKQVYKLSYGINWCDIDGLILMNHGVFTFADDARTSYELMIRLVSQAEAYLEEQGAFTTPVKSEAVIACENLSQLASLRRAVSDAAGTAMIAKIDTSREARGFASLPRAATIVTRGTLTPDHVIYTKRTPLIVGTDVTADVADYATDYRTYFQRNADANLTCLDAAPRWAVWPGYGTVAFGCTVQSAQIVSDINRHTIRAIQWAEALGGWQALPEQELFRVEYWELEQAKLRKSGGVAVLQGKVALVTGAASGIGRACVEALRAQGAAVATLDINPEITQRFSGADMLGIVCDVTDSASVNAAVAATVRRFGGLDIVVSNAGSFPDSQNIEDIDDATWNRAIDLNLSSHQRLLRACFPYLILGIDPSVVIIASKNVPAPGPGAAAYSAAKAGLTQLARVAALEFGSKGVRVNVLHPHAVFDTTMWTPQMLEDRAKHYGMSIQAYKSNNVLGVEVTSRDVAALVCALVGPLFAKTTGAQIAIDGGNTRVI
jgi:rhamnose utilization protein RhaD (predicted bifunctional aldolase and dehydrogenase)/NAD(P)-dependent dehydrogenase (short-subunit alcohol dehydrogenase family)